MGRFGAPLGAPPTRQNRESIAADVEMVGVGSQCAQEEFQLAVETDLGDEKLVDIPFLLRGRVRDRVPVHGRFGHAER